MRTAKLFKNGRSQAVRLPKEFRFEGDEVYVKRVAGGVMLLAKDESWA
ncbi:MAG: antitoxin, partial [Rhodospirillaceae bacterium]